MKKISTKAFVFGIIILLLSSTTIVSSSILTTQKLTPEASSNELKTLNILDPTKITQAIAMVNETLVRGFLENLTAFGPRPTGTYGCEKAAEYLFEQFKNMGLETRYHEWTTFNKLIPMLRYNGKNVEGALLGKYPTKEVLIFNGHYDSVEVSPGANDDGSGIAAILTAAYALSNFEFNRTIKFVAFSGEEVGLLGSRAYAKEAYENNEKILVEFNADMIGYAETSLGGRSVSISSTQDAKWAVNKIKEVNKNYSINFNVKEGWNMTPGGPRTGSDFHDFLLYGYESLAFWESEGYPYFHTQDDTIDHVNFSYLVNVTKIIVGSLAYLADMENEYPQVKIGSPRRGSLYFEDRVIKVFRYENTLVIDDILINAEVTPGNAPIKKVEFYYNGKLKFTDTDVPYQWRLNELSIRRHNITVIAYDELGRTASDEMNFFFVNLNKKR